MASLLFFRTTDAPVNTSGVNEFLQALRAGAAFTLVEEEGPLNELLQLQHEGFVLLSIAPSQLHALGMIPAAVARRTFLLGCGYEVIRRIENLQLAGALPDPAYRLPNGKWLACGHSWPVENLHDAPRRMSARYSFMQLSAQDPAHELQQYFDLYERLKDELFIEPAAPPVAAEPRSERKRSYELNAPAKNDWKENMKRINEQAKKLRGESLEEESVSPASENRRSAEEEIEKEAKLVKTLREAVLSPAFRSRAEVRAAVEKKDTAALTALAELEMAKTYVRERFVLRGWDDLKFWMNLRFLQRVGHDRADIHPDDVGERKMLTLENNSKWIDVAGADLVLTKTLMGKCDPEIMMIIQNRSFTQGEEGMEHLVRDVRQCLKQMSSGNGSIRMQCGGRRVEQFNVSYWGNEKPVTLALRAGQEGWTDSLPFTDGEMNAIVAQLLQTETATA